jgi:hypothetical protein
LSPGTSASQGAAFEMMDRPSSGPNALQRFNRRQAAWWVKKLPLEGPPRWALLIPGLGQLLFAVLAIGTLVGAWLCVLYNIESGTKRLVRWAGPKIRRLLLGPEDSDG